MGRIIKAIAIKATAPHDALIICTLELKVLSASFTEAPTIGTKLLIAKRAVLRDKVSLL